MNLQSRTSIEETESQNFQLVKTKVERLNHYSVMVAGLHVFNGMNSLQGPVNFQSGELAFIRLVSWLYGQYFELGKPSVKYLSDKFQSFDVEIEVEIPHLDIVNRLRTYLQHHVGLDKERDANLYEVCGRWFRNSCGSSLPMEEDEWKLCLNILLKDSLIFMDNLHECIRKLDSDESKDVHIREWKRRVSKHHSPEDFDPIIQIAAGDMGRSHVDYVKLRKRHYETWVKDLERLHDYEFPIIARKYAELALLTDTLAIMPITGEDIKKHFNVPPGKEVGRLLEQAKQLFEENPSYSTDNLIQKLMKQVSYQNNEDLK